MLVIYTSDADTTSAQYRCDGSSAAVMHHHGREVLTCTSHRADMHITSHRADMQIASVADMHITSHRADMHIARC